MKKLLTVLGLLFVIVSGCSNNSATNTTGFTLKSAIKAFESEGAMIDVNSKPMYELVNAIDGVLFYHNDELVRLYEFETEEAYEKAVEELSVLETFPKRDFVVIETDSNKCIEIFKNAPE